MGRRDRSSERDHDRSSRREHDRDRDRDRAHRRDRDDDRHGRKRHRSEADRDRSRHRRNRSRDRDDRRDRDRRDRRDASGRGRARAAHKSTLPALVNGCFCYICGKLHWTVACPRLAARPEEYPWMSQKKGCWRCGQRGHPATQCTVHKYRCMQCGDIHDTKDCAYDHIPEEWHEFFDPASQHVFYARSDDASEAQWLPPTHELDVVLWYCGSCQHLNPNKCNECLKCHAARPVSVEVSRDDATAADKSAASSSSDSDDEDDGESRSSSVSTQ